VLIAQERSSTAAYTARYGSKVGAQHAFTHGMDQAYLWALPVAVIAFFMSFLLKEVRLRKTLGPDTSPAPEASPAV